jgi:two-component system, NtrC family, sensor kinase
MRLAYRVARGLAGAVNTARRRTWFEKPLRGAQIFGFRRDAADNQGTAIRDRRRRALTWPLRSLLAASLAVPLLLLAFAAWQNFRLVQVQAEQRVMIETGQLHEHALSALETYALVLAWIDDRIRGLDWDRIEHDDGLRRFLSDLQTLPQIGAVSIIDAAGHIRASGLSFPAPAADASGRAAFVAQEQRDAGIFVGRKQTDPLTHILDFDISRRRSTPDDSFDGVIVISARPDYFSDFFSTISRDENFSALLVRSDGAVLVRFPTLTGPLVFTPDRPIMRAIAAEPDRGLFRGKGGTDGIARLFGYQRIGAYPL